MKTWNDTRCAWLALYLISGLGSSAIRYLVERFEGPEGVFAAGMNELVRFGGLREEIARKIVNCEFAADPEAELRRVEKANARVVTYKDEAYPGALKEISHPPALLYVKGRDVPDERMAVSVVGSRNASHYGLKAADKIAFGLAKHGVSVVSGMAKGIDSASHKGCLRGMGHTVAVLGTGVDIIYPWSNRELVEEIAECGTLVSEFPMGTSPEPKNFPIRNRIISGLSRAVVVVEATRRSGSLITTSLALEQNRDVFAVPGSIDSVHSKGSHFLIKQGAKLIESADDILEEFGLGNAGIGEIGNSENPPQSLPPMSQLEEKIYEIIGSYPIHIDELARKGGINVAEASSVLMTMEIKGIVRQLPGKMFVR